MATITYPDGSQLTSTALTDTQIQTAFQEITAQMLGFLTSPWSFSITLTNGAFVNPVNSTLNLYIGLLVTGTGIQANTLISGVDTVNKTITLSNAAVLSGVQAVTAVDPDVYAKVRIEWQIQGQPGPPIDLDTITIGCTPINTSYSEMRDLTGSVSGDLITQTDIFTRAWRTSFTLYGPNCVDNARAIRSALIKIQFVADYLATFNLYVNPKIEEHKRNPENFQGRYWNRVDLFADFNEQITETFTVGIVKSVEVIGYTKDGQFTDFTVTTP